MMEYQKFNVFLFTLFFIPFLLTGCATTDLQNNEPLIVNILESWSGSYPVSELGRLPEGQQQSATGYIGDIETFIPVWRAFMPTEILPSIDFTTNIVVFSRNTQFYNRTSIIKATLQSGIAEIIAMETMSALPIEEKVAMAMAVIPRAGVTAIRAGEKIIQITPNK